MIEIPINMMAVVSTADLKKIMECTTRLRTENESLSFALQAIVSAYQNESDEHQRLEKEIRLYQERIDITRAEVERSNLALQIKRDELEDLLCPRAHSLDCMTAQRELAVSASRDEAGLCEDACYNNTLYLSSSFEAFQVPNDPYLSANVPELTLLPSFSVLSSPLTVPTLPRAQSQSLQVCPPSLEAPCWSSSAELSVDTFAGPPSLYLPSSGSSTSASETFLSMMPSPVFCDDIAIHCATRNKGKRNELTMMEETYRLAARTRTTVRTEPPETVLVSHEGDVVVRPLERTGKQRRQDSPMSKGGDCLGRRSGNSSKKSAAFARSSNEFSASFAPLRAVFEEDKSKVVVETEDRKNSKVAGAPTGVDAAMVNVDFASSISNIRGDKKEDLQDSKMFEDFYVVTCSEEQIRKAASSSHTSVRRCHGRNEMVLPPTIQFHFHTDSRGGRLFPEHDRTERDNNIGVEDDESDDILGWVFPEGVKVTTLSMAESYSELNSALFGGASKQNQRGSHVHSFLIRSDASVRRSTQWFGHNIMYGLAVTDDVVVNVNTGNNDDAYFSVKRSHVLVSKFPYFECHLKVIQSILRLIYEEKVQQLHANPNSYAPSPSTLSLSLPSLGPLWIGPQHVRAAMDVLDLYGSTKVPSVGEGILLKLPSSSSLSPTSLLSSSFSSPSSTALEFTRPHVVTLASNELTTLDKAGLIDSNLIAAWVCPLAWGGLSAEALIDLLAFALLEKKILVVDADLSLISSCVLSFIPLLRPLEWSGIILPVLPNHMAEFLESPVPVIAGLPFALVDAFGRSLTSADELSDDTVVWFPASHSFWISQNIRNELLGTSPSLPRRDELAHMLRPFLDVLRSHSSNGNHMESMTSGSDVARTALKVSAEETATDGTARKKSFTSLFPSLSWLENSFAASSCSSIPSSLPSPTRTASSRRTLNFNPDQAQLEACSVILNVIHEYNSTLLIHVLQLKRSAQQQAKNTDNNVNDTLAVLDILNRRSHADIYDIQWRMSLADYDLPPASKSLPDGKGSREHKVVTALLESNMIHHFIHGVVAKVLKSKEL